VIAGIDEAGRGALAGPVVAAAVVLEIGRGPDGVRDSKVVPEARREKLYDLILASSRAWGVGISGPDEIDSINILEATRRAMLRAIEALPVPPDYLIVDAVRLPEAGIPCESPVKADRDIVSVAAASILAKVTRDRLLRALDGEYAGYGFGRHKGYGTVLHLGAIAALGPSPIHRRSFRPFAESSAGPCLPGLRPVGGAGGGAGRGGSPRLVGR
jgi:ribonuclease HII